jgi:hypothetical protein
MTNLALGWTDADVCPPDPLQVRGRGAFRLITAPADKAETPRQRLTLLQTCFDAGIDLIPLSPDQCLRTDRVGPDPPDLPVQLARLRGFGQLSLTLSWQIPPELPPHGSGKSWLHLRQRQRSEAAAMARSAEHALLTVAASLPHRRSQPRPVMGRCSLDLLVPRSGLGSVQARISALGPSLFLETLPAAVLLITGLWPPFSFVRTPQNQEVPT